MLLLPPFFAVFKPYHPSLSLNHHLGAFPVRISHARIQSYKSSDRGRESVITEQNKTWETPKGK